MSFLRKRVLPVAAVSLVGAIIFVTPPLLGIHTVPVPRGPPVELDVEDLAQALQVAVTPTGVDYARLREERDPLLRFVQALADHGPTSTPDRFPTRPERLAYHINAYNALVLYGVLVHRPKSSVQDVHGVLQPVPGFGFFWAQRFRLDGERTHLYALENDVIREYGDARIHAAINCASTSCPALRREPFRAARLDEQLDQATRDWLSGPHGVDVTPEAIRVSEIFDWYREDFEQHARALGVGDGVLDWIVHFAPEALKSDLEAARAEGRPMVTRPYDWGLNRAGASR